MLLYRPENLFRNRRFFALPAVLLLLCGATASAASGLRCEHRINPLGVDRPNPVLSWKMDPAPGRQQTAYRVLVSSRRELLDQDEGDLWDSGRTVSDDSTAVSYAGVPLLSGMTCFWKVKVFDGNRYESNWSEPAFWITGFLPPEKWPAKWIGFDKARRKYEAGLPSGDELILPPARYLRKEFALSGPVKRAVLHATAMGLYEMRLNGRRVGDDFFTPGWTDYDKRVYYHTYDVTPLLKEGANALGALLSDGWYSGYVGGKKRRDFYGKDSRLSAQLTVEYEDGQKETIETDGTWKANTGPLLEADLLMGELYDARLEMPGWDCAGFDESGWSPADVDAAVKAAVPAAPAPPIRAVHEIEPLSVAEPAAGTFIFDLGSNIAGVIRLTVEAQSGTKITVRFGEMLYPEGTLFTTNLVNARATDTYICKGGGVEIWQPRFTCHGFRYVEMTGFPGRPGKDAITGIELSSLTETAGRFECSDPALNQLYRNICQTQRANFMDVPTDCPQRDERLGWTGDAQVFIRTACFNMNVHPFFRKWMVDLADAQMANGDIPRVAPSKPADSSGEAAWADAVVICPWALYEFYGDREMLERQYDSMARFMKFREASGRRDRGFGDWLHFGEPTPKDLIHVAYTAGDAAIMSRAAAVLEKDREAAQYEKQFHELRRTFNREFVEGNGRIQGDTQTAYILALGFDLLDEKNKERAAGHLIDKIEQADWHLTTGFVGTRDILHVLTKIGRSDVAYRLLFNDTCPSWLFPVKNGATTTWEHWDGWTPENGFKDTEHNSFSHYAYGAVGQWMFEQIGGIQLAAPGFKKIVIRPQITDRLEWVKASYDSVCGTIAVEWRRDGKKVFLDVEIPPGTTAEVYVPGKPRPVPVEPGPHTFECTLE